MEDHFYYYSRTTLLAILLISLTATVTSGLGINWGTQATHPLSPRIVVKMLKDNGIQKVKLFDADKRILNALAGSGIQVMAGIPNDMLYTLANDNVAAQNWVSQNISSHVSSNGDGVDIKYVAVGNEPFLKSFNGSYLSTTLPALQNIQAALNKAGLGNRIKATTPLNADVYQSSTSLPSGGDFRTDIHDLMLSIVTFLSQNGSPFMTNIYPFISLYSSSSGFPFDYAFFNGYSSPLEDNGRVYTNMFDANYDTLVWALQKNGFGNLPIIVGEVGWPTDGDVNANAANAQRFNQGFINHVSTGKGTPMSGNAIDAYLFSLLDEDGKSIQPGKFERHWGIFNFDGSAKYQLSLGTTGNSRGIVGAKGVHHLGKKWCVLAPSASLDDPQLDPSLEFACGHADCTSLGYGCSCGGLDARGNVSFAFNSYYQTNNQLDTACRFPNLSVVTTDDPSTDTCKFFTGIQASRSVKISCCSSHAGFIVVLMLASALLVAGSELF